MMCWMNTHCDYTRFASSRCIAMMRSSAHAPVIVAQTRTFIGHLKTTTTTYMGICIGMKTKTSR